MRIAIAYIALSVATSHAAIDLTATLTEDKANGVTSKQLVFRDGTKQITYDLPTQWTHRNMGGSVKLVAPASSNADIVIQALSLAAPQPLDEKGLAEARQHFAQNVPPTAQTLKITEVVNTVPFKAANCEFTATYQALGENFTRRALYINLPATQLIFRLTARKTEFEGLWRTFRSSILSWQWVEPATAVQGPTTASN